MDTTYHPNIPIETLSLLDCDVLIPFHIRISLFRNQNLNIQEKYLKIGANICNIGFKSKYAYEDWQEDIFNHISVGDLVYCTMPVTDKALNAIPEGHTTRPFLIVKKGKGQLSANELAGL